MCKRKKRIKERWYELGHKRCHYCCRQLNYVSGHKNSATVEHMVPKSQGGTLDIVNCLVVCSECNSKRASKNFRGYVTGSRLPRKEWLFTKYKEAFEYYARTSRL